MNAKEHICLLSRPRSGSSYIIHLLGNAGLVDVRGEVFHKKKPFGLTTGEIDDIFPGHKFKNYRMPAAQAVHEDPARVLSFLDASSLRSAKPVAIKVFPNHLNFKKLRKFLLLNPQFIKLILDRSPIDSYISLTKAGETGKWSGQDTTQFRVELDADKYMSWHTRNQRWYKNVISTLKESNVKYSVLNYKELTIGDDSHNLNLLLSKLGEAGAEIDQNQASAISHLDKQDKHTEFSQKVSNWIPFQEQLKPEFLEHLHKDGFL